MKKPRGKFLAAFLSLLMCFTLCVNSFALNEDGGDTASDNFSETVAQNNSETEDGTVVVKSDEINNGDLSAEDSGEENQAGEVSEGDLSTEEALPEAASQNNSENEDGVMEMTPLRADPKIFTVTKHPVGDESSETLVGEYDTFYHAIDACKQEELGNQYVVTMNDNYTVPDDEASWGRSSTNIILRSKEGNRYTLKRSGSRTLITLYQDCNFKAENVILDGDNTAEAFFVAEGTLTLGKGCVLQNFNDYKLADGPAIYVTSGTVNILDGALIQNNKSDFKSSGVIELNRNATLNIYGGEFIGNRSAYFGGVILSWGNINISGGAFKGNYSKTSGGAIASYGGNLNITGGVFEENSAGEKGGAIVFSSAGGKLTVSGAEFRSNSANLHGGAIYMQKGLASIDKSVFSNNEAEKGGGALFVLAHTDKFNITESKFEENSAPFGGGIYTMDKTNLNIESSEFTKNEAAYGAGIATAPLLDIDSENSSLNISSSKFNSNLAFQGAGAFISFPATINGCEFKENEAILAKGDDENNPHNSGTGGAIQIMNYKTAVLGSLFENNKAFGSGGAIAVSGYIWDESGNISGTKENIGLEVSANTQFLSNEAEVGQGGAIYFAPYQYELNISDAKAYKNLKTDGTTLFRGNKSGEGLFNPPLNFADLSELKFDESSDVTHGMLTRRSILNNYDVNYKNNSRIVAFDANEGKFDDDSVIKHEEFTFGDKIILPASNPTRDGYTFKEWNTQSDGKGTKVTEETVVEENMTVYAVYSLNAALINSAPRLELADKTITVGDELDLSSLIVKAEDSEDGDLKDKVLIDKGEFNNARKGQYEITFTVSDSGGASISKKAIVTVVPKIYTVTYDLNGGAFNGKTDNITVKAEDGEEISILKAPTRAGYKFLFWKGSKYNPGDKYTVTGDHRFVAEWEKAPVKTPDTKNFPKTDDASNSVIYAALSGFSGAAILLLCVKKRRKELQ